MLQFVFAQPLNRALALLMPEFIWKLQFRSICEVLLMMMREFVSFAQSLHDIKFQVNKWLQLRRILLLNTA